MPIQNFSDKTTEEFFKTGRLKPKTKWASVERVAKRKLDMVHYASKLTDLKAPPNNHLEALKRDLKGYHSIRINDQWRVIFRWTSAGASEVRIDDYH